MSLADGVLRLSNGKGNAPLVLPWPWELPQTIVIHWTGAEPPLYGPFPTGEVVGGDLGEVHLAAAHDGRGTIEKMKELSP